MTKVSAIVPITRATDARAVALDAYEQLLALLDGLNDADWSAPTECPGWTVADMVGHLIGAAEGNAAVRELARQQLWGVRHRREFGGYPLDGTNALQIRDHADLTPAQRVAALRAIAPRSVAGRLRWPGPLRAIGVPQPTAGSNASGAPSAIRLGHLFDVIYTRDVWLHTIDIARATGRPVSLERPVNGRIVADVVSEWARRHGQPFTLTLSGPAGGEFAAGEGGEGIELDAVEFCRALSGRAPATGLLTTRVYF